jgi:peptidoglycan-associated lipoprotein
MRVDPGSECGREHTGGEDEFTFWTSDCDRVVLMAATLAGCAKRPLTATASSPSSPTAPPAVPSAPIPTAAPAAPAPGSSRPVAPGGARPSPKEFVATGDLKDIHFDYDKYEIRPKDAELLGANARWIKAHPNYLVLIEGHCDERGTNEYNLTLGERRAKSTMNYLVAQGVQANRINMVSYGEERPLCTEKNDACWSQNRRAHFLIKPQ